MRNYYYQTFNLLISVFLPLYTHQTFFNNNKRQNFYALNKPIMLPQNPIPHPQPIQLSNHMHGSQQPMQLNPQLIPQNGHIQPIQNGQISKTGPIPFQSQLQNSPHPQYGPQPLPTQMPQNGQPVQQHPQIGHPVQQHPQIGQPIQQNPQIGHPVQQNPQIGHPVQQNPQIGHPVQQNPQIGHPVQQNPQNGQPIQQNPQNGQFPQFFPQAQPPFFPHPQQNSKFKFGQKPMKGMQHLHPPKKGPIPIPGHPHPPMPMGSMPMSSMLMPQMMPPPNSNQGQKIGIPTMPNQVTMGGMKGFMMPPVPMMTKGPPVGQWTGVTPSMTPEADVKQLQILEPVFSTSQPMIGPSAMTTNAPDNTSLVPVLSMDNVTFPMEEVTERMEVNSVNETRLVLSSDEPWVPIVGDTLDEGRQQLVMSHANSSSQEFEPLPDNQAMIGPHPFGAMPGPYGNRADMEKPSKLESIKRGLYGILFGRKGPPEVVKEFHRRIPPPRIPNSAGSQIDSRWRPMENKLQMMANRMQQEKITCKLFTSDVCLEVNDYPFDIIMNDLMRNTKEVNAMYSDVTNQDVLELLDGISSKSELSYTNQHYFGNDNTHSHRDYGLDGGNVCPSEILYSKPRRGRNIKGEWKYIINVPQFPQTIRLERCLKPKSKCSYIDPFVHSQCSQLHTLQRILVWNVARGLHIDVLMFPSACSCYLLPVTNQTNESNDIPFWDEDTMIMDESVNLNDAISNTANFPSRKMTRTPNLLGPYTRTLHKYSRDDLVSKDRRPHTNFGRPLVSEKGYLNGEETKINYNQHSTSDYIKPWN